MIKTSVHSIKNSNVGKADGLIGFIEEYRRVVSIVVDSIWENGYVFEINGVTHKFSVKENLLVVPKYIDYKKFTIKTTLTARAMSHLVQQVVAILSASTEKQRKRLFMLDKMKKDESKKDKIVKLVKKIKQNIPQKPNVNDINPELSSKCCSWIQSESSFDGFLKLSAIFSGKRAIYFPIRMHKHSNKIKNAGGEMMSSFLLKKDSISIRWKLKEPEKKKTGTVVGADQGVRTTLTLSDGQVTKTDTHGHNLDTITDKLSRCKKGSNAFKRAQDHRENYINWSINQIDFTNIREIRLERIWNIGYKSSKARKLSHFTNTLIRDKVEQTALENGVHFLEQDSTYRSQRCYGCGVVRKANRKGKVFECNNCGSIIDSDLNAAKNHEQNLPEIPYTLRMRNLNRGKGFFWKETGFFDFSGRSLESLPLVEDV